MTLATEWVARLNRVTKGDGELWGKLTGMLLHDPGMQARTGIDVQYKLWNAIELAGLQRRFGTVIDCFFRALSSDDRRRFAQELALVTAEGARHVLLGFAVRLPMPNAPSPLTAEGLHEMLSPHWRMEWHRASRFITRWAQDGVPALMCSLRRTGGSAA